MTSPLIESGRKLFSQYEQAMPAPATAFASSADIWPQALWQAITDAGIDQALVSEACGGFGFPALDVLALLGSSAAFNLPVPLGETLLANNLFAQCGLPTENRPTTVASGLTLAQTTSGWHIAGTTTRVPYARHAHCIAALARTEDGSHYLVKLTEFAISDTSLNLAGEARDTLRCDAHVDDDLVEALPFSAPAFHAHCALIRSAAMAGALEAVLERCVGYANERQQFGRPIGKFQAIQHYLATMAGEVAASRMAVDMAAALFHQSSDAPQTYFMAAAAAKVRCGEASGIVAKLAHQIHGAIGFSWEYHLHPLTRRLWAWREEFGNESYWSEQIGQILVEQGPGSLWPTVTRTGEAQA